MTINPHLVELLETYEPEHLSALLNWLEPTANLLFDEDSLGTTELLFSQEETPMSAQSKITYLPTHQPLLLEDQIAFSLLNEFGTGFSGKAYFHWLRACVSQRFNPEKSAK